jgi:hypothetical protein
MNELNRSGAPENVPSLEMSLKSKHRIRSNKIDKIVLYGFLRDNIAK